LKTHHKWFHSYNTIRHWNRAVHDIRGCINFLKDQSADGTTLNEPLENLKNYISQGATEIIKKAGDIDKFFKKHEVYDLTEFADKTREDVLAELPPVITFANNISTLIVSPSIKGKRTLAAINVIQPITFMTSLQIYPLMQYTGIMNDWLDASSYSLKGIDPNDGSLLLITDEEKKNMVRGWLNQFVNLLGFVYPLELKTEVTMMTSVKNWVLANLDSLSPLAIAAYIDANVPKLPLIRRIWTLG